MIVLGIDPGEVSGWAVHNGTDGWRGIVRSGIASCHQSRVAAVLGAARDAADKGEHWRIVAESWTPHGRWSYAAQQGTGAQWGAWVVAIDEARRAHPSLFDARIGRRIAYRGTSRVPPNVWYRDVIGTTRDRREQRLARVMATCRAHGLQPVTHDEACACAIAIWAAAATQA